MIPVLTLYFLRSAFQYYPLTYGEVFWVFPLLCFLKHSFENLKSYISFFEFSFLFLRSNNSPDPFRMLLSSHTRFNSITFLFSLYIFHFSFTRCVLLAPQLRPDPNEGLSKINCRFFFWDWIRNRNILLEANLVSQWNYIGVTTLFVYILYSTIVSPSSFSITS
jgi:hypothetical protein